MGSDAASGGVKKRARWCPTGPHESWWVQYMSVDSFTVTHSLDSDTDSAYGSLPLSTHSQCQLRYCYSQPVALCTPCRSQTIASQPRSLSSRKVVTSTGGAGDGSGIVPHIVQAEPPCWLIIPNWNESFLHHAALFRTMVDEGLTVWSFDPRAQGLSENNLSTSCHSIESFDMYALDLKSFLCHMKATLPPGTRVNILASGVIAEALQSTQGTWMDCGIGQQMVDKVILVSGNRNWLMSVPIPWFLGMCDKSSNWIEWVPKVISPAMASVLLNAQVCGLRGFHSLLYQNFGGFTFQLVLKAMDFSCKAMRLVLPRQFSTIVTGFLKGVLRNSSTRADFGEWLHDTPSLVYAGYDNVSIANEKGVSEPCWISLYRRYPFLIQRGSSLKWYLCLVNLDRVSYRSTRRCNGIKWLRTNLLQFAQVEILSNLE